MAIAFVQDDAGAIGDGGTLAFTNNVAANSTLFACIAMPGTPTVVGITDTLGNTWTLAKRQSGAETDRAEIWSAHSPSGGANTLTFDWSGAATAHVCISEFSGFANGVSLDQTNGANSTGTTIGHGSITTTVAAAVSITCMRTATNAAVSSRGDGFTSLTNNSRGFHGYKVHSATETVDGDITFTASEVGVGAIADFYETAGGGGGTTLRPSTRMLLGVGR